MPKTKTYAELEKMIDLQSDKLHAIDTAMRAMKAALPNDPLTVALEARREEASKELYKLQVRAMNRPANQRR